MDVECVSRESLACSAHTHSAAEGNVIGTLEAMAINSASGPTKEKRRDK